jgi:hypothetical protein
MERPANMGIYKTFKTRPSIGKPRRPRALRNPWGTICQFATLTRQGGENKHPCPTISAWTLQCWSCGPECFGFVAQLGGAIAIVSAPLIVRVWAE